MRYPYRFNEFPKALNLVNRTAEIGPRFLDSYQGVFHFPELLAALFRILNNPRAGMNEGPKEPEGQSWEAGEIDRGEEAAPGCSPFKSTSYLLWFDSVFKWVLIAKYLHSPGTLNIMASFLSQTLQKLKDIQEPQMESRSWAGVGKGGPNLQTSVSLCSCSDGESLPCPSSMIKSNCKLVSAKVFPFKLKSMV